MFLQIDVYPDNGNDAAKTLFVSPATIVNQDEPPSGEDAGRLLSIGRKDADVVFSNDKAISRKHALLRLVSNDAKRKGCMKARDEEENKACQDSPLGMCLVLENLGKCGSYVIQPQRVPGKEAEEDKKDDDDATDDETDDEGASQHQSQSQAGSLAGDAAANFISTAAKRFYGKTPVTAGKLEPAVNKVLSFEESKDNTIFVQFGPSDVRPSIRITWIPLRMVLSSSISASIKSSLYLAGAVAMDGVPDETTTHLVNKDCSPTPKVMIAWLRGIPIVSPEYCKALIDRKDITKGLPEPDLEFSSEKANPKVLSKFTFLSLIHKMGEVEQLAEAAGGTVIRLHDMFSKDADILHHVEAMVKEQEDGSKKDTILVALEVPSKTKGVSRAKVALFNKIKKLGIPATNAKAIAKAITNQALLQDTDQNVIPGAEEVPSNVMDDELEKEAETPKEPSPPSKPDEPELDTGDKGRSAKRKERETEQEKASSPKKRRTAEPVAESTEQVAGESTASKSGPKPAAAPSPKPMAKGPVRSTNTSNVTQLQKADKNGWFSAAPKDENIRKEFRKKANKAMLDETGLTLEQPAATGGTVIVVDPEEEAAAKSQSRSDQVRSRTGMRFGRLPRAQTGGPNFKRFRKNYITPVDTDDYIVLVADVSEKVQKKREMNEAAQKLEEEQREADALFRGIGMSNAPKKRRRKD